MDKKHGFTLVEVTIVLVIVGLLVGGILVGKNLIRSSEIRSVGTDVEKYKAAILLFKDQYNAMPGDMKNATQFWGAVAGSTTAIGTDATCDAYFDPTHTARKLTCNGNGNGMLNVGSTTQWHEPWYMWQHLSNAGLIEGSYTGQGLGAPGTGFNSDAKPGFSCPLSKVHDLTYALKTDGNITDPADYARFVGAYGNALRIGKGTEVNDTVFKPAEAFELDSKIDDGKPGTGILRSYKPNWRPKCATDEDPAIAEYQVTNDVIGCNLLYLIQPPN